MVPCLCIIKRQKNGTFSIFLILRMSIPPVMVRVTTVTTRRVCISAIADLAFSSLLLFPDLSLQEM